VAVGGSLQAPHGGGLRYESSSSDRCVVEKERLQPRYLTAGVLSSLPQVSKMMASANGCEKKPEAIVGDNS
jgi:hypothetical protein